MVYHRLVWGEGLEEGGANIPGRRSCKNRLDLSLETNCCCVGSTKSTFKPICTSNLYTNLIPFERREIQLSRTIKISKSKNVTKINLLNFDKPQHCSRLAPTVMDLTRGATYKHTHIHTHTLGSIATYSLKMTEYKNQLKLLDQLQLKKKQLNSDETSPA